MRPRPTGVTTASLASAPTRRFSADEEGWPVDVTSAEKLAEALIDAKVTLASGLTDAIWKLLPPRTGAALARAKPGQMVKCGDYYWGHLAEGSILVRKGREYGHLCNVERLVGEGADLGRFFAALADSGIHDCGFPNSAGAVGQAILLSHARLPDLTRGTIPWPALELAHQCDKGGRMEALQLGTFSEVWCYDYTGAYAAILATLPDSGRSTWCNDNGYHPGAFYGFIRCKLRVPGASVSPIPFRAFVSREEKELEGLRFVTGEMETCLIKPEYDLALAMGCKAEILDAWWGYPHSSRKPFASIVQKLFALRSDPALKAAAKTLVNAMIGQLSSVHGHWDSVEAKASVSVSPCWNSVYASYVRGLQRVKLFQTVPDWTNVCGLTIDGFISAKPLTVRHASSLGELRLDGQGPCTIFSDYAKDRPGKPLKWREAAETYPAERGFLMPMSYYPGLSAYNTSGVNCFDAHKNIGRKMELWPEIPIGSCTRIVSPAVTTRDLLAGPIPTRSMDVAEIIRL